MIATLLILSLQCSSLHVDLVIHDSIDLDSATMFTSSVVPCTARIEIALMSALSVAFVVVFTGNFGGHSEVGRERNGGP